MSEVWYTVLGSVIGIVVTWVFNLVTICKQLYDATIDITEIIRQDNMSYLK